MALSFSSPTRSASQEARPITWKEARAPRPVQFVGFCPTCGKQLAACRYETPDSYDHDEYFTRVANDMPLSSWDLWFAAGFRVNEATQQWERLGTPRDNFRTRRREATRRRTRVATEAGVGVHPPGAALTYRGDGTEKLQRKRTFPDPEATHQVLCPGRSIPGRRPQPCGQVVLVHVPAR